MLVLSRCKIEFCYVIADKGVTQFVFLMFFISLSFSQDMISVSFSSNRATQNEYTWCENNCCTGGVYGVSCGSFDVSQAPILNGYNFVSATATGGYFYATGFGISFSCPSYSIPAYNVCWRGCTQNYSWPPECSGNLGHITTYFNLVYVRNPSDTIFSPCSNVKSGADAILATRQAECEAQGGVYSGEVIPKNNGDYCVEGECNFYSSCPADSPAPPAQRRIVLGKKLESEPKEENTYDYTLQYKPKPFYDALGRRTEPRPETRRHLFEKRSKAAVRGREPDMGAVLRIEEPVGQCCVESFGVRLVGDVQNIIIDDKVGVNIEFNAKFHGEEYEPGCNPSCCEFKQESKGSIFKNGNPRDTTTCRIDGVYIVYDSTAYVPDCYGRDCSHSKKGMDKYNDSLGTYKGTDFPGLNNISIIDTVDIRMEFNSYIKDKCNANEVKASKYWGFHMQGNIFDNDSLDYTLLGGISQ